MIFQPAFYFNKQIRKPTFVPHSSRLIAIFLFNNNIIVINMLTVQTHAILIKANEAPLIT